MVPGGGAGSVACAGGVGVGDAAGDGGAGAGSAGAGAAGGGGGAGIKCWWCWLCWWCCWAGGAGAVLVVCRLAPGLGMFVILCFFYGFPFDFFFCLACSFDLETACSPDCYQNVDQYAVEGVSSFQHLFAGSVREIVMSTGSRSRLVRLEQRSASICLASAHS